MSAGRIAIGDVQNSSRSIGMNESVETLCCIVCGCGGGVVGLDLTSFTDGSGRGDRAERDKARLKRN